MLIYIFFLFLLIILVPDLSYKSKVISTIVFFLFSASLIGLRGESVGVDTAEYYWIFYLANTYPEHHYILDMEPAFVVLNKFFGFMFNDAAWMLYCIAVFVMGASSLLFFRYSPSVFISWLGFISYGHFFNFHNIARQSIAIAIIMFSVKYIIERKFLQFIIMLLVASSFHYSAFVFVIAYFIHFIKISSIYFMITWCVSLVFVVNDGLFLPLFKSLEAFIPSAYINFLEDDRVASLGTRGLGIKLIISQIIFLILLYSYKKIEKKEVALDIGQSFFIKISMLGFILANVFAGIALVSRINHYFTIFIPIAVPIAIYCIFTGVSRFMALAALFILYVAFYIRTMSTNMHGVFPYTSFF